MDHPQPFLRAGPLVRHDHDAIEIDLGHGSPGVVLATLASATGLLAALGASLQGTLAGLEAFLAVGATTVLFGSLATLCSIRTVVRLEQRRLRVLRRWTFGQWGRERSFELDTIADAWFEQRVGILIDRHRAFRLTFQDGCSILLNCNSVLPYPDAREVVKAIRMGAAKVRLAQKTAASEGQMTALLQQLREK